MCANHATSNNNRYLKPLAYFLMISLGIISGLSDISFLHNLGNFISELFIKIFKFISLPIIGLSLIVTLTNYNSENSSKFIWKKTILYTLTTTLVAALISFFLYLIISPTNTHVQLSTQDNLIHSDKSYLHHITNIIPNNLFSPFIEHQVLSILIIAIIFGLAIRKIPNQQAKETIQYFFQGAHSLFLTITQWIIKIIPIGLFGFMTVTVLSFKKGMDLKGLSLYLAVIILANLIQGLIVLPLWLKANGIQPFKAFKGMLPALTLAFFSKSSAGTLPVTISTSEKNLNISPSVSRFVLPLCTSINMNGCAAFIFATVIYLMQNQGIEISLATMLLWVFIATIAAIGNAGVPMGCFFLSASLLASMDVSIVLLMIILPFYSIIDMIETSLNVWSDSCVTQVVDKKLKSQGFNT
ncbi:dicarboxylate/amino acid:cation symporter [Pigmentibacter sp. JX0631]|uniref:dicarboxylate/amino acid:cation symporter n=1 Tax=Pigmentibacter sp. JX0631 TaxID=2976982 RepID=UPI002469B293|nr:dicarboxylate/amino acid:cation symporter [Pigmentibacter sp. JX0631]WGL59398.1 dicarboxylate/amino acid:cation symporter [Pigmentibacter sp. JX0631]